MMASIRDSYAKPTIWRESSLDPILWSFYLGLVHHPKRKNLETRIMIPHYQAYVMSPLDPSIACRRSLGLFVFDLKTNVFRVHYSTSRSRNSVCRWL